MSVTCCFHDLDLLSAQQYVVWHTATDRQHQYKYLTVGCGKYLVLGGSLRTAWCGEHNRHFPLPFEVALARRRRSLALVLCRTEASYDGMTHWDFRASISLGRTPESRRFVGFPLNRAKSVQAMTEECVRHFVGHLINESLVGILCEHREPEPL